MFILQTHSYLNNKRREKKMNLFDWNVVWKDFWELLKYLKITLWLTFSSAIIGLVLALLIAIVQIKKIKVLRQISTVFISLIRGTPILVQLYISYFGIPIILKYINYYHGTHFKVAGIAPIYYAIFTLGINTSAFFAVTIKAAFESVNKGQLEAAHSLGLTYWQTLRRIIIPEATEVAIPSIGNSIIGLIKGTSLAFTCSVVEMAAQSKILAGRDYRYFESYVALAIIYCIITIAFELIIKLIVHLVHIPDTYKPKKKHLKAAAKAEEAEENAEAAGSIAIVTSEEAAGDTAKLTPFDKKSSIAILTPEDIAPSAVKGGVTG